jgi:divalent metal cation (Fe/Co/Zn/Cd) transporter
MRWLIKLIKNYTIWDLLSSFLALGVTLLLGMTLITFNHLFSLILAFIIVDSLIGVFIQFLKKYIGRKKPKLEDTK